MRARRRARIAAAIVFALLPGIASSVEIPCGALSPARREAVRRGTEHLKIFFEGEESRAALGTDAVSIFLELGETAADPEVARSAMEEARRLAAPLAKAYAAPKGLDPHESLTGALSLLPDSRTLHLPESLSLSLLSSVLSRVPGGDPDETYYGFRFDATRLDALDADTLFNLLIDSYTVERARSAFPDLPAPAVGLGEVLRFARARPFADLASGDAGADDFYLATHVAYVLSDYSRVRLDRRELGPLLAYLRSQVPHVVSSRDTEAAAEIADVLRQAGETDGDADVCRLTRLLLETQRPDGAWPRVDPEDAYDVVHPTWVAVHALRERVFLPDARWPRRMKTLLAAPGAARVP